MSTENTMDREKGAAEKFFDGCHRYGWAINLAITALMLAYFMGSQGATLDQLVGRVQRLEDQVYELNHYTRGLKDGSREAPLPPIGK